MLQDACNHLDTDESNHAVSTQLQTQSLVVSMILSPIIKMLSVTDKSTILKHSTHPSHFSTKGPLSVKHAVEADKLLEQ